MKKPVSKFAFQVHNLQRYAEAFPKLKRDAQNRADPDGPLSVGLYQSNPVDPQLESAWFEPLNLKGVFSCP